MLLLYADCCSDCDLISLVENLRMNNHIAGCQNEAVAYAEFVTGLVDDYEIGIMSRNDVVALFDKYAGSNSPLGKCFYMCLAVFQYVRFSKCYRKSLQTLRKAIYTSFTT